MRILFLTLIYLLWCTPNSIAQFFPQQSLYTYNALPIIGAAAGKEDALSITLSNRTMWRGVAGAPKTQYVNVHMPLKNENFAVGMQVMNDKIGVTRRTGIFGTGVYRIALNKKSKLAFGLTAGLISNSNRWSDVITNDIGDNSFELSNVAYWLPNFGASAYYHDKLTFIGISVPYILTETYAGGSEYKAVHDFSNYNFHLMGGRTFNLNKNTYVKTSALAKYHSRSSLQADITGVVGRYDLGEIGLTIRPKQAMVLLLQSRVNDQLKIAYGYDFIFGTMSKYERGTHEIALTYTFIYRSNAPNTHFF